MIDAIILMATGVCAGGALVLARRRRQQRSVGHLRQAAAALDGCTELLGLVRALQQHRGLSSGWLAGESSFERRMRQRRQDIEAHLHGLTRCAAQESGMPRPCLSAQDLALFRFQWRELTDDLAALGVDKSIARHSQLIARALDWLAALGEARVKLTLARHVPGECVDNYTDRLPQLAECLGQLRALGSSAAASRQCSPVARVRLRYLTTRSAALLREAHAAARNTPARDAAAAVNMLLDVVQKTLLDARAAAIEADAYFDTATRAIDAVYAWIDASGTAVRQALPAGRTEPPPAFRTAAPSGSVPAMP
jgi:hypothetical protein